MQHDNPGDPLFDDLYARAMLALRELPRGHDDRRHAAELIDHLLGVWPHRLDERVERELATFVLRNLDEPQLVMPLLERLMMRRHRTDVILRLVRTALEQAHRHGHHRLLVTLMESVSGWHDAPRDLDRAILRSSAELAADTDPRAAAGILAMWAEREPAAAEEIREILDLNPRLVTHEEGAPCLFLIAPREEGARVWARRVADELAWLEITEARYGADRRELVHAIRDALDVETAHAVRTVLLGWLGELRSGP